MSIETRTKIASVTVGAGGISIIDINNIPQTYSDLIIEFSLRHSYNGMADMYLRFSDAGGSTQYTYIRTGSNGIAQESTTASSVDNFVFAGGFGSNAPASYFGNGTIYIPDYTNSRPKTLLSRHGSSMGAGSDSARLGMNAMYFNSTSPITRLYFSVAVGWAQNSTVSVYGVNNARRTAGNSIKAIGGNVEFDGTYVTHTFTATGSFTPTANIPSADILVVAGGGGGGGGGGTSPCGGGGGGGGLRYFSNRTLIAGTTYTCTVGAGGNGGTGASSSGVNGSNGSSGSSSQFGSLTATTGGGYGARSSTGSGEPGGNGGSGGGAGGGGAGSTTVATGIAGEGNNGGIWSSSGNEGAGGGGAGSVGVNSYGATLGAGGAGLTYFGKGFAGGGGGGRDYISTGLASHGGGRGGYGFIENSQVAESTAGANFGRNGIAGSGGGGGGGAGYLVNSVGGNGGAGGSGTVIIRYKG